MIFRFHAAALRPSERADPAGWLAAFGPAGRTSLSPLRLADHRKRCGLPGPGGWPRVMAVIP